MAVAEEIQADPTPPAARPTYGLTGREVEVLRMVATGQSDREIAEALFISPRTVQAHLTSIFAKLDVKTRTAAAAAAHRLGIA